VEGPIRTTNIWILLLSFTLLDCVTAVGENRDTARLSPPRIANYQQLEKDVIVDDQAVVLQTTAEVPRDKKVDLFLESDGRYFPYRGKALASVQIFVDSKAIGSSSVIDWRKSPLPAQHSFNSIASVSLEPGKHVIALVARSLEPGNSFQVGAGSNLIVLQTSAHRVIRQQLAQDSGRISGEDSKAVRIHSFLALDRMSQRSAVLLSGRVYWNGSPSTSPSSPENHFGDAMVGVTFDDLQCPSTQDQSWSVNDLWMAAELQAPVYSQGISQSSGTVSPTAVASAFPWIGLPINDLVYYKIGAGTTLIGIENPRILGAGYNREFKNRSCDTQAYVCFGSTPGDYSGLSTAASSGSYPWPGCPKAGDRFVLAETDIDIPQDHDGVLAILAKTRVQADRADPGGIVFLGLSIDAVDKGSVGTQELHKGDTISQRTLCASYLVSSDKPLAPGRHHISVWMRAVGSFIHVSANKDLSLLYFD